MRKLAIHLFMWFILTPLSSEPNKSLELNKSLLISKNAYIREGEFYKMYQNLNPDKVNCLVENLTPFEEKFFIVGSLFNESEKNYEMGKIELFVKNPKGEICNLSDQIVTEVKPSERKRILFTIEKEKFLALGFKNQPIPAQFLLKFTP